MIKCNLSTCGKLLSTPLLCTRCRFACYCSKEHQKEDWVSGHRTGCQKLPGDVKACLNQYRLMIGVEEFGSLGLINCRKVEVGDYILPCTDFVESDQLDFAEETQVQRGLEQVATRFKEKFSSWSDYLLTKYNGDLPTLVRRSVLLKPCQFKTRVKFHLNPLLSLVNHHCRPNTLLSHTSQGIMLRAQETIPAYTFIYLCYEKLGPALEFLSRHERNQMLQQHYGFECLNTCCKNTEITETGPVVVESFVELYKLCPGLEKFVIRESDTYSREQLELFYETGENWITTHNLPPTNLRVHRFRMFVVRMFTAKEAKRWLDETEQYHSMGKQRKAQFSQQRNHTLQNLQLAYSVALCNIATNCQLLPPFYHSKLEEYRFVFTLGKILNKTHDTIESDIIANDEHYRRVVNLWFE